MPVRLGLLEWIFQQGDWAMRDGGTQDALVLLFDWYTESVSPLPQLTGNLRRLADHRRLRDCRVSF